MTTIRTDVIGPQGEMQMKLMIRRGSYFVQAKHVCMPGIIGFRRINCQDFAQAERSYFRSVEASTAELTAEVGG
jgi:hypothetical protein